MTDIDHMIAVLQAFKEGKTIQYRARCNRGTDENWGDAPSQIWNWASYDYRIKPAEPRRIWVNTYGNRMGFAYASREQADANADAGIYRVECVEFVEVVK